MLRKKNPAITVSKFGAAILTLYTAPQLQAEIVDLTPTITQLEAGDSQNVSLNTAGGGLIGPIRFINDGSMVEAVETFGTGAIGICNMVTKTLHTDTNCTIVAAAFSGSPEISITQPGTRYLAFVNDDGNVGWFKLSFDGPAAALFISGGKYGTDGESLPVGQFSSGDVNQDGLVDLLDVDPFVELINSGGFQDEADINQDGIVDLLDVAPMVNLLTGI